MAEQEGPRINSPPQEIQLATTHRLQHFGGNLSTFGIRLRHSHDHRLNETKQNTALVKSREPPYFDYSPSTPGSAQQHTQSSWFVQLGGGGQDIRGRHSASIAFQATSQKSTPVLNAAMLDLLVQANTKKRGKAGRNQYADPGRNSVFLLRVAPNERYLPLP